MALVLADRVLESTPVAGTGDANLGGAVTGYQPFSTIGNGNTTYYTIVAIDDQGAPTGDWEVGIGTYVTAGNKLTRDTVLSSSNGGAKVYFASGTKQIFLDLPSEEVLLTAGNVYGPTSSTNSNFALFDGTTGKLLKDAGYGASAFATAAQGAKADTAVQPGSLGSAAYLTAGAANGVATLDSSAKVPISQLPAAVLGALSYQGTWNASTNTPTLVSSAGTKGYYYVVSVAGTTNLNGITDWQIGDWAVYDGSVWEKVDNTDLVTSVNSKTGAVVLTYSDVGAQPAGTYVTSVSATSPVTSTGGTTPTIAMPAATTSVSGYLTSTDWNTFNGKGSGSVTSISGTGTISGISLSGTVTTTGSLTLGGTLDLSSPPVIGGTTPNTITGTTINANTKFVAPDYYAQSILGGNLRTSGGTSLLNWDGGGSGNVTVNGGLLANPANKNVSLSPTGSGTVTINPATAGTFNNMVIGGTTPLAGTFTSLTATGTTTLATSLTGLAKLTSGVVSTATSGTDYAPATSGTSILYGNGAGGFSNVTIGSGVSFASGTLSATGSGGTVTSVSGTSPISSTGGTTPAISISQATTSTSGYLSSTDWNTFNNKQPAGTYVTAVTVVSANGFTGTSNGGATPALTLGTSITGLLKGNGTAISAATSGTDYAPATSGSSILYGNGAGGFSNVTVGSGLSFSTGTLSATSSMVYPGAGIPNSTGSAWGTSYTTTGSGTVVALATSPTFATSILGDFSNATLASRTLFKTSTTNAATGIYAVPNGTSTAASWQASNAADPTNASKILIATNGSTDVQLVSGINGTGTYLPMGFWNNGAEKARLSVSGGFSVGTTTDAGSNNILAAGSVKGASLIASGSTSGSVTIQAPAVAGSTTLTLPATTGTVMVNGPAFSAYQSSAQTPATGTWTKLTFTTKDFDTNSNFASSTFTPTVAGYYQVNAQAQVGAIPSGISVSIYKNGAVYKSGTYIVTSAAYNASIASILVYCNGTTDYIDAYVYIGTSGALNAAQFSAAMVRSA